MTFTLGETLGQGFQTSKINEQSILKRHQEEVERGKRLSKLRKRQELAKRNRIQAILKKGHQSQLVKKEENFRSRVEQVKAKLDAPGE